MGRDFQAGSRQTGVPQGRDPPRQHLDTPLLAPQLHVCKSLFCMGSRPSEGALPGGVAEAPAPCRVLTWGMC